MLTLLNIGNTHTGIACWNDSGIELSAVVSTAEFDPEKLPSAYPIAAASVVPAISKKIIAAHPDTFFISPENTSGLLDFSQVDPSTLGADRIANAVAAAERYPLPAMIADCGSAVTVELVDEKRRFRGGAISPGRQLMRQALFRGTAQLPDGIALAQDAPRFPGTDTVSSIVFGIDRGIIGSLREITEAIRRSFPVKTMILTGGDASFFARELTNFTVAEKNFTFYGIASAALYHNRTQK